MAEQKEPKGMWFLKERFGIDFAEQRYNVEVLPEMFVECYCDSIEQATKIVTEAGYRVLSVTLHVYEPIN